MAPTSEPGYIEPAHITDCARELGRIIAGAEMHAPSDTLCSGVITALAPWSETSLPRDIHWSVLFKRLARATLFKPDVRSLRGNRPLVALNEIVRNRSMSNKLLAEFALHVMRVKSVPPECCHDVRYEFSACVQHVNKRAAQKRVINTPAYAPESAHSENWGQW